MIFISPKNNYTGFKTFISRKGSVAQQQTLFWPVSSSFLIKGRVERVEVFGIQLIGHDTQSFTEAIKLSNTRYSLVYLHFYDFCKRFRFSLTRTR